MQGRPPASARAPRAAPLPPVTTRRPPASNGSTVHEQRIVPPFVGGPTVAPRAEPSPALAHEPEPEQFAPEALVFEETQEEMGVAERAFEQEIGLTEPVSEDLNAAEAEHEHHVTATQAALESLRRAAEGAPNADFPADAFIFPEETTRPATPSERSPLNELALRLERVSQRLRAEGADTVLRELARGDRLDALLAGLLAGYLAGARGES